MDIEPMEIIVAIHNIRLPKELLNIIVGYSVTIMFCNKCKCVLQKDYSKLDSIAWVHKEHSIQCKKCVPSLSDLYDKIKIKSIVHC
jgi:hypothetical protein